MCYWIFDESVTTHGVKSYVLAKMADRDHFLGGAIYQSAADSPQLGDWLARLDAFSRSLACEGLF